MIVNGFDRMFFGLCCAGVEHGDSDRGQGVGQAETCRADGLGAMKDGRAVRRTCHAEVPSGEGQT